MEKKIIIVTGASRGIGKEIAKTLAKEGHTVIANYNKSEKEAQKLKEELKKENKEIEIYKADISKEEEIKKMVEYTIKKYKKIDILINNAGIDKIQLSTEVTKKDWDEIINTNLYGTFYITQQITKNMIQNKKGKIINISSIWGQIGASMEVVYSISKAGVDGLTKALAKELGPSGIQVNSIAPGFIKTEMNSNFNEQEINEIKDEIPLQKLGECEDIARCIKWLIEDKYVTGQIIAINGGWSIT